MERGAAEHYAELAARMRFLDHEAVAEILERLAGMEFDHLSALQARAAGLALPEAHLDLETPVPALSPRHALLMALAAENRAQAFYEQVMTRAEDPAVRALAREMAAEEAEHAELLLSLLEVDLHQNRAQPVS
jgi:rubrerythrin